MNDRELFIAALQLNSIEERAAFLNEACGTVPERRLRIEKLLHRHEESESILNPDLLERTTAFELNPAIAHDPLEGPGDQIGHYTLLQKLGDGGMGTVWVAEQEKPVKRRVALKLVKAGMDSAEVLRRFEAERQALAMMDHTNIAKVFDAGTNAQGRPYFVMELIKGVPITKYCDEVHASIRDRLDLFIQVCSAVQHAHQKGIIHRDIKPSNVLVAMQDGKPVPKVIDFGVAKALHTKLADKTMYTEIGHVVGTLEYMAPEQAELSAMDIDTRADIYALGILLYELLTGSTPITRRRMKTAAFAEILRIIKEEEPTKPSTRLSESKEGLASLASLRRTDPKHLSSELRGELDWVVLKALEKDRNRRYETASGFAADIHRYLLNEPVKACPPSTGYRLRKFVQRNRKSVLAAALVLLVLLAGIAGTTLGMISAAQRETREMQAKQLAEKRLAQISCTNELLLSIFRDFNPSDDAHDDKGLRKVLGDRLLNAAKDLHGHTDSDPIDRARLQITMGRALLSLSFLDQALDLFSKARTTFQANLGKDSPLTLGSMTQLARCYMALENTDRAIPLLEESLRRQKALPRYISSRSNTMIEDRMVTMNELAYAYHLAGKPNQALQLSQEALDLQKKYLGPHNSHTLCSMNDLGLMHFENGNTELGLSLLEDVFTHKKNILGPTHHETIMTMHNLATAYLNCGQVDRGLPILKESMHLMGTKFGIDHPSTLVIASNLASHYLKLGRYNEARKIALDTLKYRQDKLGKYHPDVLQSMIVLANIEDAIGKHAEALALREEVLTHRKSLLGADHAKTLQSKLKVSESYGKVGRLPQAIQLNEAILEQQQAKLRLGHPDTINSINNLAWLLTITPDQTAQNLQRAITLAKQAVASDPKKDIYWTTLGAAHFRAKEPKAALTALQKALELRKDAQCVNWFYQAMVQQELGANAEARTWVDKAVQWMEEHQLQNQELQRLRKETETLVRK